MDNWNSGGYSFETDRSISDEDDEMAAFEAECARLLEQEHERRAREAEIASAAEAVRSVAMPTSVPETQPGDQMQPQPASLTEPQEEPDPETEDEPATEAAQEEEPEEEKSPAQTSTKISHHDELAAIMLAESNESLMHSSAKNARENEVTSEEEYDEKDDETLPRWLSILFSLLLLLLGAAGLYVMTEMDYHSSVFDPLCFIEISLCFLTAIGLNASLIPFRVGKEMIMRIAAYALFAYYVIYAADQLFLKRLLTFGIDKEHFMAYAKSNINMDVTGGLSAMGYNGMLGCVLFVLPFAFMLLMLFKPLRNVLLYLLTVAFLFFAVSAVRILTLSGSFDLAQGCMAAVGAVAAYVIFALPPINRLMNGAGLIVWDYDEYEEDD